MKLFELHECTEWGEVYGCLVVEDDKVSCYELQHKIGEIKKKFDDEGNDDWQIEDVIEELPKEWGAYFKCMEDVEI